MQLSTAQHQSVYLFSARTMEKLRLPCDAGQRHCPCLWSTLTRCTIVGNAVPRAAGIPNVHELLTLPYDANVAFQQNSSSSKHIAISILILVRVTGWDFTASDTTSGTTSRDLAGKYPIQSIRRPHNCAHYALPSWNASCAEIPVKSIGLNAQFTSSVNWRQAYRKLQQRFDLFNLTPSSALATILYAWQLILTPAATCKSKICVP